MNESIKLRILSLALILILSGTFTFCGDTSTEVSTHFVYKVDGISKEVQSIAGIIQTEIQYDHKKQTLTMSASNSFAEIITVSVSNWDFQTPPENGLLEKEYDATYDEEQGESNSPHIQCIDLTGANAGVTICDGGIVTFTQDSKLYTSIFTGNENGTITITKCDPEQKSISGSFAVQVQYAIGQKLKLAGTFTNVKYTVF